MSDKETFYNECKDCGFTAVAVKQDDPWLDQAFLEHLQYVQGVHRSFKYSVTDTGINHFSVSDCVMTEQQCSRCRNGFVCEHQRV